AFMSLFLHKKVEAAMAHPNIYYRTIIFYCKTHYMPAVLPGSGQSTTPALSEHQRSAVGV
ncbi:MAG: hypothetical protein PUG39_03230, partial [Succiniclasticum sp.]|nr:hypothetical protein [Succiniclasticum sp.]